MRDGPKHAATALAAQPEAENEPLPNVGVLNVILDGRGDAVCAIGTTQGEICRFGAVDEDFANDEGEGDRTLASWRSAHRAFSTRIGIDLDDDTPVVLERFELLWLPLASCPTHNASE